MKILSVLNPSLDDYKISGAALLGINLGEYINHNIDGVEVDYVASSALHSLLDRDENSRFVKVFIPELSKRNIVKDTIKYSINKFYEDHYDVLHIHLHQMSVISAIAELIPTDIPVVYTQHSSTILGRFSLGYRPDAYKLSSDSDRKIKIVCPSLSMKKIWQEYIESDEDMRNVTVIRNGINTISSEFPITPLGKRDHYISCGRIDPNKGMLEVAKFCVKYGHKITLVGSLGMGSMKIGEAQQKYYDDFVNLVNNNSDILKWFEYVPNTVLIKMMSRAKGYISMSNKESFGLTVAEAMSVGTPVLYLEEQAVSEITDKNSSIMIPRDALYRKTFEKRLPVFEECFRVFESKIDSGLITVDSVQNNFHLKGLSIGDCARNYIKLYQEIV